MSVYDWRKLCNFAKNSPIFPASSCELSIQLFSTNERSTSLLPNSTPTSRMRPIRKGSFPGKQSRGNVQYHVLEWFGNTDTLIKRVGSYSGHLKTPFCSIQIYIWYFVKSFSLTYKTDRFGQTNLHIWIPKAYANHTYDSAIFRYVNLASVDLQLNNCHTIVSASSTFFLYSHVSKSFQLTFIIPSFTWSMRCFPWSCEVNHNFIDRSVWSCLKLISARGHYPAVLLDLKWVLEELKLKLTWQI